MNYKIERQILQADGETYLPYWFEFENVSIEDAKRLADMLKWNTECGLGNHRENGTPSLYGAKEIEGVRIRSRAFLQPPKKA